MRNLFVKTYVAFAALILVSFTFAGSVFLAQISRYSVQQNKSQLENSVSNIQALVEHNESAYVDTDGRSILQLYLQQMAVSSNSQMMVADAEGNSAVLEWVNATDNTDNDGAARQLNVIYNTEDPRTQTAEWQCVTNFILTEDYYESEEDMKGQDRYEHLFQALKEKEGKVEDDNEAMKLLSEVGRRTWNNDDKNHCTVHSVVYNLTDRTALWVSNEHYGEEGYVFELSVK